jgi:hypothetical protein
MGWETPIAVRLGRGAFEAYRGGAVSVGADGAVTVAV